MKKQTDMKIEQWIWSLTPLTFAIGSILMAMKSLSFWWLGALFSILLFVYYHSKKEGDKK